MVMLYQKLAILMELENYSKSSNYERCNCKNNYDKSMVSNHNIQKFDHLISASIDDRMDEEQFMI